MNEIHDTDPKSLARILDLDSADADAPTLMISPATAPSETTLRQMFTHQLAARISDELDLPAAAPAAATAGAETFAQLLDSPAPALGLLEETKNFAKASRSVPDPAVQKIATALYYASVACALVRANKRISELSDAQLTQGFSWAIDQPWIDGSRRRLFEEALGLIAHR